MSFVTLGGTGFVGEKSDFIDLSLSLGETNAFVDIRINGISIRDIIETVSHIEIEQTVNKIDFLRLRFDDVDISDGMFKEKNKIEIFLGTSNTTIRSLGEFSVYKVRFYNLERSAAAELLCYGDGFNLALEQKSRRFEGLTHAEIVQSIAQEHNLLAVVQDTKIRYDEVVQSSETDFEFIRRLASYNGFVFYVRNGRLVFRSIGSAALQEQDIKVSLNMFSRDLGSLVKDTQFEIFSFDRLYSDVMTFFNPLTGEVEFIEQDLNADADELLHNRAGVGDSKELPEDISFNPKRRVQARGKIISAAEQAKFMEAITKFSTFVIKARFRMAGVESIHKDSYIFLRNIPRFDGLYYVSSVIHRLSKFQTSMSYFVDIECWKKVLGVSSPQTGVLGTLPIEQQANVTNKLVSEGRRFI